MCCSYHNSIHTTECPFSHTHPLPTLQLVLLFSKAARGASAPTATSSRTDRESVRGGGGRLSGGSPTCPGSAELAALLSVALQASSLKSHDGVPNMHWVSLHTRMHPGMGHFMAC